MPAPPPQSGTEAAGALRRRLGLPLGLLVFVVALLLPAPGGLEPAAWRAAAVALLMAVWWVTEAIPIPATALLPLALFPLLGIASVGAAAAPYANPIIFLFLGGFILALAMQRWRLHRRLALGLVHAVGAEPHRLVLGFMLATAFLSMWVSNTATAVMMLPIGLSVIQLVAPRPGGDAAPADGSAPGAGDAGGSVTGDAAALPGRLNFGTSLMLGIAYAASIGGLATLIGTPPNALLAGYMLSTYGVEIGFARWMLVGLPLVALSLPLAWLYLTRVAFPIGIREIPGGRAAIGDELRRMGPISRGERRVAVVFTLTAVAWIIRPLLERWLPGLSDTGIAMIGALALFLVPVDRRAGTRVMDWETAEQLPWGVLLLFGGGLSLAAAIADTGLADWIGAGLAGLGGWPTVLLVLVVTAVIVFLTELTSNTATAAAFLPVLGPLAVGIGHAPLLLVVPAALAASCAFMMPVATPPNAIIYGSGYVTIPQMARAGLWLNVLFIGLITAMTYLVVGAVFAVTPGLAP